MTRGKEYYAANKEHIKAKTKEYRIKNPNIIMYTRVKGRARRTGIPFNLDLDDIQIQERCPVFDIPYVFGCKSMWNPSLDRIVPSLGYVKGNVIVISVRANSIKNDATPNELRQVAEYVDKLLISRYD